VIETPTKEQDFRGVSLKSDLVGEVETFIREHPAYRSVSEFVSEAIRLRMEQICQHGKKAA
jgi:metal-responsive CopG/Arc/MetJ family transcriptional regulator